MEGIGKSNLPVMEEVIIQFKLSVKYTLKPSWFIIIPDKITEYDVIIGYDILEKKFFY